MFRPLLKLLDKVSVVKSLQDGLHQTIQRCGFVQSSQITGKNEKQIKNDDFMSKEIENYEIGKRWLAKMMGENADTFTQKDIDEAIKYLLPSRLFAKDARPMMKHPSEIFPAAKDKEFDVYGRPYLSGFYTGIPKFYDLTYKIWQEKEKLASPKPISYQSIHNKTENSSEFIESKRMQWLRKFQLEEKLGEKISDKHYEIVLFRLKKLSSHSKANEIQDFLQQFQVPIYTPGREDLKDVEVFDGCARSMGYRKSAKAEVIIKEGTGKITVNNKPFLDYFIIPNDREQIMFPLVAIGQLNRFDIETYVIGGGTSGKSGAIRLGISRCIAGLCPEHFEVLNSYKLLTRDWRFRERKKPGRKGARRAFQWVRR
ncbi:small ribosomal subunit protein uS9m [Hydra vulgaris]|uniref:small ribosomal subunit protein uS9m n=1 Tax=Hydra vulgaris TaxID=6087 RepID=UPI001F5E41F7|nr:28S ribosomal protein S9, mitochondrial [Hydra vulgaris]